MAFTIVITELLAKPVPLALFRLSATGFKDAGFVHFIVEFVCTLVRTQVQVLVLILHIYKFFSQLVQKRDFSLLFPPPSHSAWLFDVFLQFFLLFFAEEYLKIIFFVVVLFQINHRLGEKRAKTKIQIASFGPKVPQDLETKCYFTSFALRINMECSSFCISHFFAVRLKCLKLPCELGGWEDKGASLQSCKGLW